LQVTVCCAFWCPTCHDHFKSLCCHIVAISDCPPCALQGVQFTFSGCPLACGNLLLLLSFRVLQL
jgi:hypothetical protein